MSKLTGIQAGIGSLLHRPASRHLAFPSLCLSRPQSTLPANTPSPKPLATPSKGDADAAPPSLDRPLGFPMPMQPLPPLPTFWQRTKTLLTTPGQHKQILAEEGGSYWRDFHAMRHAGGKQWTAPSLLFRKDKALYFPNVAGTRLGNGKEVELRTVLEEAREAGAKAFLVRCYSATSGEEHVRGLIQEGSGLVTVDLNMQTNLLKHALLNAFRGRLQQATPEAQQARYLIMDSGYARSLQYIGVVNAYVGYSYLLDIDGKIRWASSGALTGAEGAALAKVATRLMSNNA